MHRAVQDAQCGRIRDQAHDSATLSAHSNVLCICKTSSLGAFAGRFFDGTLSSQHGAPSIWALSNHLSTAAELLGRPQPSSAFSEGDCHSCSSLAGHQCTKSSIAGEGGLAASPQLLRLSSSTSCAILNT